MRPPRFWLEEHHRQLDHVLADTEFLAHRRSFALAKKRFKVFQSSLLAHLKEEEDSLFPMWQHHPGAAPTLRLMAQQHAQLEVALEAIDHALKEHDYSEFCYGLDALSLLLHRHQTTEEDFLMRTSSEHLNSTTPLP